MEFLLGNPYSTPVGQCLEKATDGGLQAEDWTLNMEICDIINETEEGPKDAIRALKKRLSGNRNYREVMLGLTVLETCVKNCGHRFHVLVANRDFIDGVLVKIISPKTNPPTIVQDKVLALIQAWADAFRSSPDLTGVVHIYEELKRKGIEFPMADLDTLSPIHTPQRGLPEVDPAVLKYKAPIQPHAAATATLPKPAAAPAPAPAPLTPILQIPHIPNVQGPITANPEQELNRTCRAMQQRVVELISRVSNEEVTEELLHVNDDLNNIFLRYERYERYRSGRAAQNNGMLSEATEDNLIDLTPGSPAVVSLRATSTPPSSIPPVTAPRAGATASPARTLIQDPTSGPSTLSTQLAGLDVGGVSVSGTLSSLSGHNPGDDFDMFAQTRTSSLADQRKNVKYEDPRALGGLASALDVRQQNATGGLRVIGDDNPELELPIDSWLITQGMIPVSQSSVMDDIEEWLCADVKGDGLDGEEGVTSEEFDKFLEDRAKVVDSLPSLPGDEPGPPLSAPSGTRKKAERTEDALFAL
ncbi:TOM1-like protein 2 [Oncorhynchus clarkii lewisi]|uniref:TOM1-like protein 2 n=1 Tax=Oncorhynchus clarkii lewisi TaxID=490388 RepID=UPI0039B96638